MSLGSLIKKGLGLIPGVGTGLELVGGAAKAFSKNSPQKMSQQLTPEQKLMLQKRYSQLQAKANDPTALNYMRKAGGIYDKSMGL